MDEHKSRARHLVNQTLGKVDDRIWSVLDELAWNQDNLYRLLESQLPQETPQASEKPSSPAIETEAGTKLTSPTSSRWSFHASRDGIVTLYLPQGIGDWLNSQWKAGNGRGTEIGLTLTSRASTPLGGSPSPSTAAPTREVSGRVGEPYDMTPFLAADGYPLSAPEPSPAPSHEARECRSPHPHCSACLCRLPEGHDGLCWDWRHDPSQSSQEGAH